MKLLFNLLTALLAMCSLTAKADETASLSQYVGCSKAVYGLSLRDNTPIVPATRAGKRGFYIYTSSNAYFYPFGKPQDSNDEFNYHYYQLSLPGQQDIYFTYSDPKSGNVDDVGIGVEGQSKPAHSRKYIKISGNDSLDDAARSALSTSLQGDVQSVTETYMHDAQAQLMHLPALSKAPYEQQLSACKFDGDKALRDVVVAETVKLSKANPNPAGQPGQGESSNYQAAPAN